MRSTNRRPLAICILVLTLFSACKGPDNKRQSPVSDSAVIPASLPKIKDTTTLGGKWILQPVLASDTATGKIATIQFDLKKSRFTGNTGCNTMNGEFWYGDRDSSLVFSEKIITTRMACPGYNEKSFLNSLLHTTHFRLRDGTLTLWSDNAELSRWARKGAIVPKSNKI
ncbi:META domain-containing protein [Flavitalea flava]